MVAHGGSTQPPLFRALLMNSPYLPPQYIYNDPIPEVRKKSPLVVSYLSVYIENILGDRVSSQVSQFSDRSMSSLYQFKASCVNSTDSLDCLRTVDATLLLNASTSIGAANFLGTCTFVPVVDRSFIIERPTATLKRGRLNGVGF